MKLSERLEQVVLSGEREYEYASIKHEEIEEVQELERKAALWDAIQDGLKRVKQVALMYETKPTRYNREEFPVLNSVIARTLSGAIAQIPEA